MDTNIDFLSYCYNCSCGINAEQYRNENFNTEYLKLFKIYDGNTVDSFFNFGDIEKPFEEDAPARMLLFIDDAIDKIQTASPEDIKSKDRNRLLNNLKQYKNHIERLNNNRKKDMSIRAEFEAAKADMYNKIDNSSKQMSLYVEASLNMQKELRSAREMQEELRSAREELDAAKKQTDGVLGQATTVLGIFVSVIVVFFGAFSVIDLIHTGAGVSNYKHFLSLVVIGHLLFNSIFAFMFCLSRVINKGIHTSCNKFKEITDENRLDNTCQSCSRFYLDTDEPHCSFLRRIWHRFPFVVFPNILLVIIESAIFISWLFKGVISNRHISSTFTDNRWYIVTMIAAIVIPLLAVFFLSIRYSKPKKRSKNK